MLSLNVSKTNDMIMTSQGKKYNADDYEIKIEGNVIDLVTNLNFWVYLWIIC